MTHVDAAAQQAQLARAEDLNRRALHLHDQGRYQEALPLANEAAEIRERLLGPHHILVAESLNAVGDLWHQESNFPNSRPLFERALQIRESQLGRNHPAVAESLTNVARVLYAAGEFSKAKPLLDRAIHIREAQLGTTHHEVGVSLVHLSIVESQLGNLMKSRTVMERAIQLLEPQEKTRPLDLAMALNYYGNILRRMGEFGDARPPLERSLQLREQTLGLSHPHVARTLSRLGELEANLGNPQGALSLLERALTINEQGLGSSNPEIAGNLNELGRVKSMLGDVSGARTAFERALEIQEQTVGPHHPVVAVTLNELGHLSARDGNLDAAKPFYLRALQVQETSLGRDSVFLAETLTALGYVEVQRQALPEAENYFARAVHIREGTLSPSHPDVAASFLNLARAKHALGDLKTARSLYEQARIILLAHGTANQGLDDTAQGRVWAAQLKGLYDYELLLAVMAREPALDSSPPSAVADSFLVAEQARGWIVQAAVARATAREALSSDSNLQLVRGLDEARRTRQVLWNRLNDLYGQSPDQRDGEESARVKAELNAVQRDVETLTKQLETTAPQYADLTLPKPTTLPTTQMLLADDEALVSWFTIHDRVLIWLVRPGQPPQYRESVIAQPNLANLIERLRTSLTPSWNQPTDTPILSAFDVETAYELHRLLLGPVEKYLSGVRHLILIPDRVLIPLPFAALLTDRNGRTHDSLANLVRSKHAPSTRQMSDYRLLPWLARSYTITVVPSASALKLLRQTPRPPHGQGEAFVGFGDPVLLGIGHQRGGSMPKWRGTRVARDQIQTLDRLPGTRNELLAIAAALGLTAEHNLFLDQNATETMVTQLNRSGRLGQARVVSFATHGLLAGELQGLSQPALVLTPPDIPTDENDGLLSLDEILRLHLPNTDWVILSACNTAGGDGSGEGLSGLARAFFFAGAKALLVSQWSVDDRATQELMTQIFQRYGAAHSVPPAQALQQGMLALLQQSNTKPERAYFAHPFAWASFFLVGEGRRPLR